MGMKLPQNVPFGIVIWEDHCEFDGAVTLADVAAKHRPETMHTVGWILKEDDKGVFVANEYYDESFRGASFIDRRMIVSVTHLKLTVPRRKRVPKSEKPTDQ
jgi:hypothetical protein